MNQALQAFVLKVFRSLPRSAKRLIWNDAVSDRGIHHQLLARIATERGIRAFVCDGELGPIQGSPFDKSVFGVYCRQRSWGRRNVAALVQFFETRPDGLFIDAGANIGLISLPLAQAGVEVVAFEPHPENFSNLKSNIQRNASNSKVTLHQLALFNRESSVKLEVSPVNSGDHRIRLRNAESAMGEESWETVEVPAVPLDSVVEVHRDRPVAIKIDTQGAEPFVVEGAQTILQQVGFGIFEFAPYWLARMGGDVNVLLSAIASFPFACVAQEENEPFDLGRTGKEVAAELEQKFQTCHDDPAGNYWDVVVSRAGS